MEIEVTRTVQRPATDVTEFFFDASNNPQWQDGMVSCEWTSEPPIGLGSTYEQHARFMGRDIVSTFEVTRFEAGRLIEIDTIKSTFPIKVLRRVDPVDETSCQITAEISGGPKGFMRLLEKPMSRQAAASIEADYDRLVELLESG